MLARLFRSVLLLALALGAASAVRAQLTPHHVAQLRTVQDAVVSPDGDYVAYTVSTPADPLAENAPAEVDLWLYDVEAERSRVLLSADVSPRDMRWRPDGMQLSFLGRGEDDAHTALYTVEAETGVLRRAVAFETAIRDYAWHSSGDRVALIAEEPAPARTGPDVPYRPVVYEEGYQQHAVYLAPPFSDETPRRLPLDGTAYQIAWHPGDYIAVALAPTPLVDDRYMRQRIHIFDTARGEPVGEVAHEGKLGQIVWSPGGEYLAFVGSSSINDPKEGRLYVVDEDGTNRRDVLPDLQGHIERLQWLDDEDVAYVASLGTETVYAAVEEDGSGRRTFVRPGAVILESLSANAGGDIVAFVGHTWEHPPELYLWTQDDRQPRRVTNHNPWLDALRLGEQEVLSHTARDGLTLEGILIRPLQDTDAPAPLIVVVHGGPESHIQNGWNTTYSRPGQMAAAQGYAVFYPNYRGSTGRGVAFSMTSQGDPAGKEFDDIVDAVDHLIAEGVADSARVGVTGGSYGGYATGWLTTRYSDRFAAGVMFVGISNKISKVGTTDIADEEFYVHALKRPWDDWQFFLERSPIYYADESRTPLLIAHGANDPRVHPSQSMELYRHLRLRGQAPVRLVFYPGEGHGNNRATARYDYSLRLMRWFDHYLMGEGGAPPPLDLDYTFPEAARMGTN